MAERRRCYYCRRKQTVPGESVCRACEAKLAVVRRLLAIGVAIKLRAAEESAGKESDHDS